MATDTSTLARRPSLPADGTSLPTPGQQAAVWSAVMALSLLAWTGIIAGGFALIG
jgi:hypothetical protein